MKEIEFLIIKERIWEGEEVERKATRKYGRRDTEMKTDIFQPLLLLHFSLGVIELDLTIIMDNVPTRTEISSEVDKTLFEAYERLNRLSLSLMKMTNSDSVKPSMSKTNNTRDFMRMIKYYSHSDITNKSTVGNLMIELTTKKFD
ncbi:hypothetical protein Lal_00008226 [Lupinus albus]|nr:hypothetical protein Lal_00008226 [Lupinus albus]